MLYIAIGVFITTCVAGTLWLLKQRQAARYVNVDWSEEDEPEADITIVMGTREKF